MRKVENCSAHDDLTFLIEPLHMYKITLVLRLKGARTGCNEKWK